MENTTEYQAMTVPQLFEWVDEYAKSVKRTRKSVLRDVRNYPRLEDVLIRRHESDGKLVADIAQYMKDNPAPEA